MPQQPPANPGHRGATGYNPPIEYSPKPFRHTQVDKALQKEIPSPKNQMLHQMLSGLHSAKTHLFKLWSADIPDVDQAINQGSTPTETIGGAG